MKICLYGAGSKDIDRKYLKIGYKLGESIAKKGHILVFGGGNNGLMKTVADGVHENSGQILAITPKWINNFQEIYPYSDKIIYTDTMNERKKLFSEKSDAFIITPGGIGTLDEFFDIITLKRLEIHDKPIVIFNIDHYYDLLIDMMEFMFKENTIPEMVRKMYKVSSNIEDIIEYIEEYDGE